MSYNFKHGFVLIIPFCIIMSCGEKDFGLGKEFVESRVRSIKIDTFSVTLSTLMLDSMTTSGKNKLLAGRVYSDEFGDIIVRSYLSFSLPSFYDNRSNSTIPLHFDSICFELQYDTYFTGDTILEHSLAIHELMEVLTLPDDGYFHNTSHSLYSINTIAEKSFNPYPSKEENLCIRLPDDLGIDILTKISSGSDEFSSQDKFNQYFRGFAITSKDPANNAVFSYRVLANSSAIVNLYYHYSENTKFESIVTISPNTSTCYYSIQHDFSTTPLKQLTRGYSGLPSFESNNVSYIFGLAGFITIVEVPAIRKLLELGSLVSIQEAELVFYPVVNTYNELISLPENLSLYIADETNTLVDAVTTDYGTELQTGNLVIDYLFPANTHYSFTVTNFIKQEITAFGINKRKLILTLTDNDMNTTMKRVIFGNQAHPSQRVKLNIICTIYE